MSELSPDPTPCWPDRLAAGALLAGAMAMPLAAVFAPLGLAPLAAAMGLAALPAAIRQRAWTRLPWPLLAVPLALAAWALVSALWALDPLQAAKSAGKLAGTALLGAALVAAARTLDPRRRRLVGLALAATLAAMALLLLVEYSTGNSVTRLLAALKHTGVVGQKSHLNRGATVLAMLAWPAALLLRERLPAPWPAVFAAAVSLALLTGDSGSTRLAILAAAAGAALVAVMPRAAPRLLMALVVVAAAALPLGAAHLPPPGHTYQHWTWVPNSWHHRLTIWTFTGQRIAEHPLRGWGMDAARDVPGGDEELRVNRYGPDGQVVASLLEAQLPLHPHNAVLQLWLELGLPGMAITLAGLLWLLARTGGSGGRLPQAAATAVFASAFVVSVVSYGFWQSWWQSAMWLAGAYLVLVLSPRQDRQAGVSGVSR